MAMSAQTSRVPSKAAPQAAPTRPASGDILFRFTTFDDYGKMKVLGDVEAWALHDDDDPSPALSAGITSWTK
jgi:hypothetical protein